MADTVIVKDLEAVQTETKYYQVDVTDDSNVAIDISGYKLFFTVKRSLNDSDTNALIKKTITCPNDTNSQAGHGFISLSYSDTNITSGNYYYDIFIQSPGIALRKPILRGKYKINLSATQRTV